MRPQIILKPIYLNFVIRGYLGAVFTSLSIIYILINKVFVNATKNMTGAKQFIWSTFSNSVATSMANASN